MAEQYFRGTNRIFYRSKGFQEGLDVTAQFLNPSMIWGSEVVLDELGSGLYFFDLMMNQVGTWVGLFYEDGEKVLSQNFYVISAHRTRDGGNLLNR